MPDKNDTNLDNTNVWCAECQASHPAVYQTEGNEVFITIDCPYGIRKHRAASDAALFYKLRAKYLSPPPNAPSRPMLYYLHLLDSCSLHCPICLTRSAPGKGKKMTLEELQARAMAIVEKGGGIVVLTGGEPTEHPEFIQFVHVLKKEFGLRVEVNTNGIRFAENPSFATACKKAGLANVELSFDTFNSDTSRFMRGRDLVALKRQALRNIERAGLTASLVCTVCDANLREVGALAKFALVHAPFIRMIRMQPLIEGGRYISGLKGVDREGVVHALVNSGIIEGLTEDDFIPEITIPAFGHVIHPDCGANLYLLARKDYPPEILARNPRFYELQKDFNRLSSGAAWWTKLRLAWIILRRMGLRGLRAVANTNPESNHECLFLLLVDNLMPPGRQDIARINKCAACFCGSKGKMKSLCAYSVEGL